jgi:tetratricopeptide (TPR) repeat protein
VSRSIRPVIVLLLAVAGLRAGEAKYDLSGQIVPERAAAVYLYGATTPFSASTEADARGRFRFRGLLAGTDTVAVFVPERGETRRTIEVGPSVADAKSRIAIQFEITEARLETQDLPRRHAVVSARELSIPERARKEYQEAQKSLSRRDVKSAIARLERAVDIAPQYSAAWNNLGTIAYQSRRYQDAERYFRLALEQDPKGFEPLVNLGGVLLTLGKLDEALEYNLGAVLSRPNDALANSQLGMTYFAVNNFSLAQKYLEIAKRLDPTHFSHPQLTLAEIHLRRNEPVLAADELEDFLRQHPDWPNAADMRRAITKFRSHPN